MGNKCDTGYLVDIRRKCNENEEKEESFTYSKSDSINLSFRVEKLDCFIIRCTGEIINKKDQLLKTL